MESKGASPSSLCSGWSRGDGAQAGKVHFNNQQQWCRTILSEGSLSLNAAH